MNMSRSRFDASTNISNIATPNIWDKFRGRGPMNVSDLVEDCTIDARCTTPSLNYDDQSKHTFAPVEFTGRSTCVQDQDNDARDNNRDARNMSVDCILADSFVKDIRSLSKLPAESDRASNVLSSALKYDDTEPNAQLPWNDIRNSAQNRNYNDEDSIRSDEFVSFNQAQDKLKKDENEWLKEYADLPIDSPSAVWSEKNSQISRPPQNNLNLTEFSGYLPDTNSGEVSLGKYFSKRSEDVRHIIPNKSPTKRQRPIALIAQSDCSATTGYNTSMDSRKTSQGNN